MLYITYFLNGFLMIAIGVGWGLLLTRKFGLGWRLYGIGALTFIASQVVHIPLNMLLTWLFKEGILPTPPEAWQLAFNCVVLGLSAGLCEEGARYLVYRWWAKNARSWRTGLLFGAGHGGVEALILGVMVLFGFFQMVAMKNIDLAAVVPADQVTLAQQQIAAYWSANWYDTLLGAVERFFTVPLHLACAVLVLQTFTRRRWIWLPLAIGWHALADGVIVAIYTLHGAYIAEIAVAAFSLASVAIIWALRQPEPTPEPEPGPPTPPVAVASLTPQEVTAATLEESRYN
ncbi:MAG TPA: YhfC family glutamic-type intramembrane protease [Anaerolineae bacterium]|nr:YhfC family glutamic-type intramembrane protease [Anaerolineae bacterium]